jgi:hypothetical protein
LKITELLEKQKDTDEYSYQQAKNRRPKEATVDLVGTVGLSEKLLVNDYDQGVASDVTVTASREVGFHNSQSDDLSDYYKLNRPEDNDEDSDEEEGDVDGRVKLEAVDVGEFGYGEKFKPTDKTLVVRNNLEKNSQSSMLENNDSFEVDVLDDDEGDVFKPIKTGKLRPFEIYFFNLFPIISRGLLRIWL